MNDEEARIIARAVVRETLISLGIDQNDFAAMQKDLAFLRAWRESTAAVKRQGLLTAIGVVTVGILGLIYLAIKGPPV